MNKTSDKPKQKKKIAKRAGSAHGKYSPLSALSLLRESLGFVFKHKKPLLGVAAVFFVIYLVMIRSSSSFDIDATQQLINNGIGSSGLFSKTLLTGILIGSGASASTGASSLTTFIILIIGSLAFIWAIRHLEAAKQFKIRDAFYNGMYPLIPFLLVLLVISLQLIPFALGGFLYATAEINGIISSVAERVAFIVGWGLLGSLSVYWISNSIIGVYAVTLPGIYPMQALRSTKKIVKSQRWSIILHLLVLSVFLAFITSLVLLGVVILLPVIAVYVYDVLFVLALMFTHVYLFKLYRSLI